MVIHLLGIAPTLPQVAGWQIRDSHTITAILCCRVVFFNFLLPPVAITPIFHCHPSSLHIIYIRPFLFSSTLRLTSTLTLTIDFVLFLIDSWE